MEEGLEKRRAAPSTSPTLTFDTKKHVFTPKVKYNLQRKQYRSRRGGEPLKPPQKPIFWSSLSFLCFPGVCCIVEEGAFPRRFFTGGWKLSEN